VTLDESNAALRAAVTARHEGMAASLAGCPPAQAAAASVLSDPSPCCDGGRTIPVDYILRGEAELRAAAAGWKQTVEDARPARLAREASLRPGSAEFLAVLDELRDLHLRKTLDYGVDEDALSNIRSSADIVNMPAWAGCVLRMMDKMHRLKAYFRRGRVEFDGLSDTLKDLACYAVIAEVLRRQEQRP
jgi:hypothetical protein